MARQQNILSNFNLHKFNPKKAKKYNHLIQVQFKKMLLDVMTLPLRSRLKVARIIIFKDRSLFQIKHNTDPKTTNNIQKDLKGQ